MQPQMHSQEVVIDDKYLLEQKYSNMLQDVLAEKQMELFEAPSVVQLLKKYQREKMLSRSNKPDVESQKSSVDLKKSDKSMLCKSQSNIEDEKSSFGLKTESDVMSSNEIIQVIDSSTDFSIANCYNTPWTQNNFSCDLVSSKYDASYQHDTSSQLLTNVSEANSNQPE
ncbi:uncharacterized protein LOC124445527 isoform X2 [Xenia sp. Carnegie-2017]|uniref:uncharacterized protein LOC124445527 isoform X2 n=1 Tax=Xenia sp. Carnegie-2017 TaxID=2897299 RepID=UPI001F0464A3|nr:uncharacterized protein LOC124445527 isoform X2 [Xenia sp. Carnegie-2017]